MTLIKKAIQQDKKAQEALYNSFSPKMLGVCRRYVKDVHHAEELMLTGFLKVFKHLKSFKNEGSFEGWIRRIMVHTCISYLRKIDRLQVTDQTYVFDEMATVNLENTTVEDIQRLIDALPTGYKMVFNLYVIEGYKHSEIAKKLGITESTSKTQLLKARKRLQEKYTQQNKLSHGK